MLSGQIGHYRITGKLGQGGMGEIFSAFDEKLNRNVALKQISTAVIDDDRSRRRFLREARAAASLNHPFICTVHEVLEHEGAPLIVMERVEGHTLHARLARGIVPVEELCALGSEIAEALVAAHDGGVVHRDIKSGNIMITHSGHVKVMDFGLAVMTRPSSEEATARLSEHSTGGIAGTLPYIAPEVLRGEEANAASDMYALGVVLFEMATGRRPFVARTDAMLLADVLSREPVAPRQLNSEIPPPLNELILSLLQKDPAARPAARYVVARLRAVDQPERSEGRPSLGVLPFRALTSDPENAHLGVALADATTSELALLRALLVRPTAAILRYDRPDVDPIAAGLELGVDSVVAGTFQRSGKRLRVTVQLISVSEKRPLWSTKIDTTMDDLFAMQDEVSRKIADALQLEITPADEQRLDKRPQAAGDVLDLHLKGRAALLGLESASQVHQAIEYFRDAADLDPNNPLPLVGLSDAYCQYAFTWDPDGDWYDRAKDMADRALQLDPDLPEGRYLRGRLAWSPRGGFDHAYAMREFIAAIAERPNMNEAFDWLGTLLFHVGLVDEAQRQFQRALAINPEDQLAGAHQPACDIISGNYPEALRRAHEVADKWPTAWTIYMAALAQIHLGDISAAEKTLDGLALQFPGVVLFHAARAIIAALRGNTAAAQREIERTVQNRRSIGHYHHAEFDLACALSIMGKADEALDALTSVIHTGYPCLPAIQGDPLLANARSHPRYEALLREVEKTHDGYRQLFAELQQSLPSS